MWVLYFLLLAVPLCDAASLKFFPSAREENGTESWTRGTDIQDVKNSMEQISNKFLQDLIDARRFRGNRQRRELSNMKTPSVADKKGVFRLKRIKPFLNVCSRPISMTFVDVGNSSYAVCISSPADDTPTTANIALVTTKGIVSLDSWYTNNPAEAVSFYDGKELYVLVADSGRDDGTDLVKFNFAYQKSQVDHTVHSKHATAIALWTMEMDGNYHLAIANSNGEKDSTDLTTEVFTYNWMGTYFDKYSSFTAYDVKDIEAFHIHNMAYLAVANHRRGKENYHVDSEILKYNLDQNKWLSLQKIRTYGAMDWEFFTFGSGTGKEFYLAVANYVEQGNYDINSMIYKFVKDKFVPFQCLLTSGATSIAALSDGSKFLLAIANEFEAVHLYQYDGWRFVPASVQYTQSTMSSGVTSVSFRTITDYKEQKLVLAVSNPRADGPSLYELEFAHENALGRWHNDSADWCMSVLDGIEEPGSEKTLIDMNSVIFTDQEEPIVINGNFNFESGFDASLISTPELIDIKNRKTYDGSMMLKLNDLKRRLAAIEQRLQKAEEALRKAVTLDGSQTLLGNYSFKDLTFNCEDQSCHFKKIDSTSLNGDDISDLKNKLVFIDEDTFVAHTLNIEKVTVHNLHVNGLLDGVDVSNVVTKSGTHYITGVKTFTNPIKSEIVDVAGLVDGVKVTPHTILLNGGYQNASGNLTFVDIDTNSLEVTGLVNGVNLDSFYRNLVLSDKSYIITGLKTFSDVVVKDLTAKSVNGVDLSDLWNKVMWIDNHQEITAPMTFATMVTENDLIVDGNINGLKLPGPEVLLVNSSAVINAPKIFKNSAKTSKLNLVGSINGIGIMEGPLGEKNLDILLKDGTQVITGEKTFREIFLDYHSHVSGTVNGIKLSELQRMALHKNSSVSGGPWIFNNLEVKGPLTVHGSVSGMDLNDIYSKAVKIGDALPNFKTITFKDGLHINELESEDVNGLDLTKDLVFTKKPQTIRGVKIFKDMHLKADSEVLGLVNNINVTFLKESILKLGNQVITFPQTAEGNVRISNLKINGLINGVKMEDLVTLKGDEVITGPKTFTNVKSEGNLYVGNLEVTGLVNSIDITEKVKNTMTYDGAQIISGPKSVTGKITLSRDSNLDTDSLNGIDISSIWEDAVLVDVPQNISGNKVFEGPVSFSKFWFRQSLDGVTEWDLKYNWMLQDLDQEVFGDAIIAIGANVSDIVLSGYVNDVNIIELNNTIVKKNEPAVISGNLVFEDSVISYGDISLTGKIENVDLSEEAVLKSEPIVITGEKEFLNDLTVIGDLFVAGLIDGISVQDFCENSISLNQDHKLSDLTIKGNLVFESGVNLGGLLAGIDIDTLYGLSIKEHEESFINGLKTFENLTIEGPVKLYGKVGGMDLKLLKDTYMSLSRDQEIATSLHFDKIEAQGTITASNFYTHDNEVNDIDIVQLEKSVLKTSGVQKVTATYRFNKVIFGDDVIVVGRVNAIEIPKGLMRPNRSNYVYNSKIFKRNVTVLGDLIMEDGKTVQDVDVSEWERKSVLKDKGEYVVDGLKIFSDVTMNDVRVHGTIDGKKIAEDYLLMTYGDQKVEGIKDLVGGITALGNLTVEGLINGVDLEDIARRAARRGHSNTFTGVKYFSQPIAIGALETNLINGVDIWKLNKTVYTELNFDSLANRMAELDEAVSETKDAFNNQAILFQYYEYFQGFRIPGSYSWHYVAAPDTKEILLLSDISLTQNGCTSIKTFILDPESQRFEEKSQNLLASYAVAMESTFIWDSTYLFVANRMPSSECSSPDQSYESLSGNGTTPGHIFVWSNENEMFTSYQTIMMEPSTDVAVFSDGDTACAVYTGGRDTKLYCAEEKQKFTWRETLKTRFGRKITLIEDDSERPLIRLAVAGVDSSYYTSYVDIFIWKNGVFGEPVQRIETSNAQSVMFMEYPNVYSTMFLVISDDTVPGVGNIPRLLIYRLDEKKNKFTKYQEIKDSGHLEWVTLPTGDLIFFVLDTVGNINTYRYRHASRFVREDVLYRTGAKTFLAFARIDPEDSNHYLALAGPQSILPLEPEDSDFAKILKSNVKGRRLLY